jgi:hypothetical protein
MLPNQQTSQTSAPSSFASLLARFAAQPSSPADDDGLADDVVSLSYEQALRTHARYRPAEALDSQRPDPLAEFAPPNSDLPPSSTAGQAHSATNPALSESRRGASVTLRMSHAECAQLHERAAAAGLTVSAYLRSCIFEVESLRAQVKDALSQLHAESRSEHPMTTEHLAPSTRRWRWFSRWHRAARS